MRRYNLSTIITFLLILNLSSLAQSDITSNSNYKNVLIKNTEIKSIYSEAVGDSFYLYIKLPKNYNSDNRDYPVLYLLDGDISFPMATSIVRYLQFGEHVPELIIVGIGYGTMMSDSETNYRGRDYNLPELERRGLKGGGDKYLNFLKNELIPFVESNYRVDTSDRAVSGHSLGAQYVIYILLNQPELFDRYVASSPHMINSLKFLLKSEEEMQVSLKKIKARLFISRGSDEPYDRYGDQITKLVERLSNRDYQGIKFENRIFTGGSHFVCPPEAMSYGLKYVFED